MIIEEALQKFGLSDKESKVYLAALNLGQATVLDIAKKSGITRSTVYSVLESLIAKALISEFDQRGIKHYRAESPQKIVNQTKERYDVIKSIFPDLKNIYLSQTSKTRVTYYQGKEAMRDIYYDILHYKGLKQHLWIGSETEWITLDPEFFNTFKKERAKAGIKVRLILEDSPAAHERIKSRQETNAEIKLIPKHFPWQPTGGVHIFPDKIILDSYTKDVSAVEIVSQNLANTFKMMFEFMWSNLPSQ